MTSLPQGKQPVSPIGMMLQLRNPREFQQSVRGNRHFVQLNEQYSRPARTGFFRRLSPFRRFGVAFDEIAFGEGGSCADNWDEVGCRRP